MIHACENELIYINIEHGSILHVKMRLSSDIM